MGGGEGSGIVVDGEHDVWRPGPAGRRDQGIRISVFGRTMTTSIAPRRRSSAVSIAVAANRFCGDGRGGEDRVGVGAVGVVAGEVPEADEVRGHQGIGARRRLVGRRIAAG